MPISSSLISLDDETVVVMMLISEHWASKPDDTWNLV
jgi:hypothetical protein